MQGERCMLLHKTLENTLMSTSHNLLGMRLSGECFFSKKHVQGDLEPC